MNNCSFVGRLGRDPEGDIDRETPYAKNVVAVNRPTRSGEDRKTDWIRIVAFRGNAKYLYQYGTKGRLVAVTGRLQITPKTEEHPERAEVVVTDVNFLDRVNNDEGTPAAEAQTPVAVGASALTENLDDSDPFADE